MPSGFGYNAIIGWQNNRNDKWKMTAAVEYVRFSGDVITPVYNSVVEGFSVLPVMVGVKYLPVKKIYISGRAGLAIGLVHAGNHVCLSPGAGTELPVFQNKIMDIGLHLISVTGSSSFPENHVPYRGGYSYLNLRFALLF